MVCPFGWVCHAVRAPGVKWTLLALSREAADGAATGSMYTMPVNHSLGPAAVSRAFRVISIAPPVRARGVRPRRVEHRRGVETPRRHVPQQLRNVPPHRAARAATTPRRPTAPSPTTTAVTPGTTPARTAA